MHLPSLFALCIYFVVVVVCHFFATLLFLLFSRQQHTWLVVVVVVAVVGLNIIHRHFFISCLVCFGLVNEQS